MTGAASLPANFSNGHNGVVLDSSVIEFKEAELSPTALTMGISGYTGHTYQLQRSTALTGGAADFASAGNPQAGSTGSTVVFTIGAAEARGFFRIVVDP